MFRWIMMFILLWFIYQVRHVFPPIIVGGIVAYLVLPVVQTLSQKAKVPTGIATAIVYVSLLVALVLLGWFIGPSIVKEAKELSTPENQHELVHKAVEQLTTITHWQGDIDQLTGQFLEALTSAISNPEQLKVVGASISHILLSILVCVVSSIYFTLDSVSVGRFFLRFFSEKSQSDMIKLFGQMNRMLSKYVQGQILLILIMASVAWLFLHFIIHMRYALPVAVFSGFLEIIPVLGPILATSTATLVGIAQFGPQTALAIVIFYTLARWVEDYIVVPKIIGHAVELHPLAVIFAVLCGETLAGGLGMLIAIPVAACIKLVLDYYFTGQLPSERRQEKKKKRNGGQSGAHVAGNVRADSAAASHSASTPPAPAVADSITTASGAATAAGSASASYIAAGEPVSGETISLDAPATEPLSVESRPKDAGQ